MYALQPMWTVAINWVVIVLNGNCHTFSEACIRACVIFRTSIYVKIFRAGWHCFSVACEGEISNSTNREVFFYWPASGWSLFGRPLKKVGLVIWKSIPVNKLDLINNIHFDDSMSNFRTSFDKRVFFNRDSNAMWTFYFCQDHLYASK